MKNAAYKKTTTKECIFCDWYGIHCRKGHKCSGYKKYVKHFKKRKNHGIVYTGKTPESQGDE